MAYEYAVLWDWTLFAVRWLHVIAGMAWIGSSFYFIALNLGLRKNRELPKGTAGEEWQVHGGGFYNVQKYMVAPPELPEHLVWFKWESYVTWLSGAVLLAIVYYVSADLYLIDPEIMELAVWQAIAISAGSLALGWVIYDFLCKSPLGKNDTALMLALFCWLVAMAWGYCQVFSGRAAFLHLGALTATLMSANVFFVILPNQRITVSDLKAGRAPDPKYGIMARQRSTHNNYLTLPVVFMMISNHFPLAFATQYNWLIAASVFLMGVMIRHYYNSRHSRSGNPLWTWLVTVLLFIFAAWLSAQGAGTGAGDSAGDGAKKSASASESVKSLSDLPLRQRLLAESPDFEAVAIAVQGRCAMCHSTAPDFGNLIAPPGDLKLETSFQIALHARAIYLHSARSRSMPPGNLTLMTQAERDLIARWFESANTRQFGPLVGLLGIGVLDDDAQRFH